MAAELAPCDLHSCDLHSCDLHSCDLHSCDLHSCDLHSCDLHSCGLHSCGLRSGERPMERSVCAAGRIHHQKEGNDRWPSPTSTGHGDLLGAPPLSKRCKHLAK